MNKKIYFLIAFLLFFLSNQSLLISDVSTTVNVPPSQSNYSWSIAKSPVQSAYQENTQITYTITYGNNFNIALPLTIVASWTDGTIQGQSSPSIDIADYVIGSGTNAYGGTTPTVDTTNQKITWNISNFPGNTSNQTVSFKLKTNSNYTGSSQVSYQTSVYLSTTGMTTDEESVETVYLYSQSSIQTSSPTPSPSSSASIPPLPLD